MEFLKKYVRIYRTVVPSLFLILFGLIACGMGYLVTSSQQNDYPETTAVIVDITVEEHETTDSDGSTTIEYDNIAFVEYTVDGVTYTKQLDSYSSSYAIGKEITIRYNPENPEEIQTPSNFIGYILFGIGGLAIVGAVLLFKKRLRQNKIVKELEGEYSSASVEDISDGIPHVQKYQAEAVPLEGGERLYFKPDKSFSKQGHIMEDANRNPVVEGKIQNFTLTTDYDMDFINHVTGKTTTHQIGHTITSNGGVTSCYSYFDYDGEDVWEYLHRNGVQFAVKLNKMMLPMNYTLRLRGKVFAELEMSGVQLHEDDKKPGVNIPHRSMWRIRSFAAPEELDLLFLCVVAIARTEMTMME